MTIIIDGRIKGINEEDLAHSLLVLVLIILKENEFI